MNKIQKIILDLVENTSFNNFDGEQIAKDLRENENKWLGFIFGKFCYSTIIPLRDIDNGFYNADTIYIKVKAKNFNWLKKMVKKWKVNEFGGYLNGKIFGVWDDNLRGLIEKSSQCHHFNFPLGATPKKDIVYARLWWD